MNTPTMDALMFDGPAGDASRTRVGPLPVPAPGPTEVLIRVTHAGINFKDVMMRRGDPGYVSSWPVVPGLEVAGEIVKVGGDVQDLTAGVRVAALTNRGGLAQYAVARAALTVRIPAVVLSDVAAAVPGVWATAWLLLHESARTRPGDTLLVHGASGGVGTAIAALARSIPEATVLGVVGSTRRLDDAKMAGYQQVFTRDDHLVDHVLAGTGQRGVDIVLDPQGTTGLDADLRMLAPTGRVLLFGNASGAALDAVATPELYANNGAVGGFSIAGLSVTAPSLVRDAIDAVFASIAEGELAPRVTVAPGLGRAATRQQLLADGATNTKHVIRVA